MEKLFHIFKLLTKILLKFSTETMFHIVKFLIKFLLHVAGVHADSLFISDLIQNLLQPLHVFHTILMNLINSLVHQLHLFISIKNFHLCMFKPLLMKYYGLLEVLTL